tara:strand:- start:374 stop:1024 length:651 start_codon:yes stop_codon:yes gene_type:complete
MKEHILDLIIVENNEDHFKVWDDYFSKKFKIKVFNRLENCLENKNIFNNDTIFIIQINQQKSYYHKKIQNNIIYLTDYNLSITNVRSDKNFYLKKPVSLSKIEEIIDELKNATLSHKEEIIRIKKYILIPADKILYSNDKSEFIKLTEKEVQILIELDNSKITSSKKHLLEKVWKYNPNIKTSTVETHIHRLRKKLLRFSQEKLTIKYERHGYYIT